jgi:hypothetical protein
MAEALLFLLERQINISQWHAPQFFKRRARLPINFHPRNMRFILAANEVRTPPLARIAHRLRD